MLALHRRDTAELLAEELRRLDPDEVYAETLGHIDMSGSAELSGPAEYPQPDELPAAGQEAAAEVTAQASGEADEEPTDETA